MKIGWVRFNIYLVLSLAMLLPCGCKTAKSQRKKMLSTIRLHLETTPDASGRSQPVPIFRANPIMLNVQKMAFLNEENVKEAKVVETVGGFALSVQFDRKGTWLLEQASGSNRGKRVAIFSQFPDEFGKEANQARWLAAPLLPKHIPDGLLVFTPDATRQEAEYIAIGLNNAAKKYQDKETTF